MYAKSHAVPRIARPKYCQSQFLIHDIEWAGRAVPLSRGRNIRGWHPMYPGHPSVAFESLGERGAIAAFAEFKPRITSQPVTIHYSVDGVAYRYTPDLLVEFEEEPTELQWLGYGRRFLVEVKPDRRLPDEEADRLERGVRANLVATGIPLYVLKPADVDLVRRAADER